MSIIRNAEASCTKCGAKDNITIYRSINVSENPELKDKVKDGSLFLWKCPSCGQVNLAKYETLTKKQLTGNFIACSPRQIPDSIFTMQNSILVNLSPENRFLTENVESAVTLAKAGVGYTLYPDILPARDAGLCYIPVTDLPEISFGVYCQNNHDHPVLKRFLTLISKYITNSCESYMQQV